MLVTKSSTQLPHTFNELKSSTVSCESVTHKLVHKELSAAQVEQSSRPITLLLDT